MKVYTEFVQYSPEFWSHRRGKPSTSNFNRILTAKTGKLSAAAEDYIAELCAEIVHFDPNFFTERPASPEMRHGSRAEKEARDWYELERNCVVLQVGGCESDDGRYWSSPDGLVGEDGLLELKCPQLKTHVAYTLNPAKLVEEYRGQCHGQLIVTGRKWVDLVSYVVGLPPIIERIVPDTYTVKLANALDLFWDSFQRTLRQLSRGPSKPAAPATLPTAEEIAEAQRATEEYFRDTPGPKEPT